MNNYRIKKVTRGNGCEYYYPQKRFICFWLNLKVDPLMNQSWVNDVIIDDYNKSIKDIVEFIEPNF
jgi:hypothetical protein